MSVRRGSDIIAGLPIIDGELNMVSARPVRNSTITAAINELKTKVEDINIEALETEIENKANKDLSNTPANVDYVIETQTPTSANNYTWYRKYKSGWVEQGGKTGDIPWVVNGGSVTVTLPVPMASMAYSVNGVLIAHTSNWNASGCKIEIVSATQINVCMATANTGSTDQGRATVCWEVKGFAA